MGMADRVEDSNALYLYIIKGHLMQKVSEDTPGAIKRDWEAGDGSTGTKWELQFKNLTGFITDIAFKTGDYGEQCLIKMTADGEKAQLQMDTNSRYFASFAQRFKNIDLSAKVTINAYDFEKDGKIRKGMSITQNEKKIESYFWDNVTKANINGLPQPINRGSGFDKDDWKMYFIQLKKFLKLHIENELVNMVPQSMETAPVQNQESNPLVEHSQKETDTTEEADDLPF